MSKRIKPDIGNKHHTKIRKGTNFVKYHVLRMYEHEEECWVPHKKTPKKGLQTRAVAEWFKNFQKAVGVLQIEGKITVTLQLPVDEHSRKTNQHSRDHFQGYFAPERTRNI